MSLNITDEETCRLADELAHLTGETTTDAVSAALRTAVEREREVQEKIRRVKGITSRISPLMDDELPPDHGDLLYDEHGLPRGQDETRFDLTDIEPAL